MELDIVSIWVRNSLVIPLYLVFSIFLLNTTTIVKKGLFLNYFSDKVKSKLDNLNERKRAGKRMLRERLKKEDLIQNDENSEFVRTLG